MTRFFSCLCVGLTALGVAGCALEGDADTATSEEVSAITSGTTVFIVPVDERVRTLCREETNTLYCDAASAKDAAAECLAKLTLSGQRDACANGGEKCLRYEVVNQACQGPREIYPSVESCESPVRNSCAYYSACLEANVACGEGGYALGYGEKYCTAFKNANFSPRGDAWVESVMLCLQDALIPYATTEEGSAASCQEIQEFAFDSHPACYTAPSNSICYLPPTDVLQVLNTIGGRELLAGRTLKQIRTVIGTCLTDIAQKVFGGHGASSSGLWSSGSSSFATELEQRALIEQYGFWEDLERDYGAP